MKRENILLICAISVLFILGWMQNGWSSSENHITFTAEPLYRYSIVNGDKEKFREDMWIRDRAATGLQEFSVSQDSKDMSVEAEGRAIVEENDYKFDVNLKKEDVFSLAAGFTEFTKYYDGTGGYFGNFTTYRSVELNRELALLDGHFFIDFKFNRPEEPIYFAGYERHAKSGVMSSLGWNSVAVRGVTRKISPSWKEVDEVLHTIKFGAEDDTKLLKRDLHWKVEQKLLYFNEESTREEKKYGATAAQNAVDTQKEKPKFHGFATALLADSHLTDWLYISTMSQYERFHSYVSETLTERDATTGTITNFSSSTENFFDSKASNTLDTYSWVTSLFIDPLKYLTASAKIKGELKKRDSQSVYPRDTTYQADFVINNVSISDANSDYKSLSESLGVRFTKLPRTVLYINGEFEQIDGSITENRFNSGSTTETFSRETDILTYRNNITTGVNWNPYRFLGISTQYMKVLSKDHYSDKYEKRGTATAAFSAFVDEQQFQGDNLTTKVDIKPYKWVHGTLKYQLKNSNIYTRIESQNFAKAVNDVSTYLGSITLIPTRNFYLTGMFSKRNASSFTIARVSKVAIIPTYAADVNTAAASATYIINPKASLEVQYQWVRSDNFNDISDFGMPYGLNNTMHRAWSTFRNNINEDTSVEINYGYTSYDEDSNNNIDNYGAHIIAGKIKYIF